jgi:hypothetical protein
LEADCPHAQFHKGQPQILSLAKLTLIFRTKNHDPVQNIIAFTRTKQSPSKSDRQNSPRPDRRNGFSPQNTTKKLIARETSPNCGYCKDTPWHPQNQTLCTFRSAIGSTPPSTLNSRSPPKLSPSHEPQRRKLATRHTSADAPPERSGRPTRRAEPGAGGVGGAGSGEQQRR